MSKPTEVYLGDGLYSKYEYGQFEVYSSNGIEKTNEVFFEPEVFEAFLKFVCTFWDKKVIAEILKEIPDPQMDEPTGGEG